MGHWCNGSTAASKPVRSEFESLMARHLECRVCQQTKPETEFSWRVKDQIRQSRCKECHSVYRKQHYQANREKYLAKIKVKKQEQKNRLKEFLWNYKLAHPCVRCGESDPIVLEFDHLEDKQLNIARVGSQGWSIEKLEEEISKCQVLCANCHRKKTAAQFGWHSMRG